ncbi:MAG: hypothetical protein JXR48_01880 [Candidatus Delongbacteria bacterium]|nr:hypothetical protein [Candidatus Delongbacteria bacterium]
MNRHMIFVEGKADACFLRDYFKFLFLDFEIVYSSKNSIELKNRYALVKIIIVGGYTKIQKNLTTKLEEIKDFNYNILIIQDADNRIKDNKHGGVTLKTLYLENIKKQLKIDFNYFLFPNNQDDGDLENLLLSIVNIGLFEKTKNCYLKWAECSKHFSPNNYINELLENKNLVYNYFRTFYGMENAKEENRTFTEDFWKFSSKSLDPLKTFLVKTLNIE